MPQPRARDPRRFEARRLRSRRPRRAFRPRARSVSGRPSPRIRASTSARPRRRPRAHGRSLARPRSIPSRGSIARSLRSPSSDDSRQYRPRKSRSPRRRAANVALVRWCLVALVLSVPSLVSAQRLQWQEDWRRADWIDATVIGLGFATTLTVALAVNDDTPRWDARGPVDAAMLATRTPSATRRRRLSLTSDMLMIASAASNASRKSGGATRSTDIPPVARTLSSA